MVIRLWPRFFGPPCSSRDVNEALQLFQCICAPEQSTDLGKQPRLYKRDLKGSLYSSPLSDRLQREKGRDFDASV